MAKLGLTYLGPSGPLKGRQIRRIRNRREAPIYIGPAIANFALVRTILANGRLYLCLTNALFHFGSIQSALDHLLKADLNAFFPRCPQSAIDPVQFYVLH
jgi:hypothetical protein